MNAWTVILAAGLGSYLFLLSMIVLFGRTTMQAYLQRASELVAPAAFAAMAAAGVATACMSLGVTQAAILTGMPVLWVTTALLPT